MKKLALILAMVCFVIALGAQDYFKPTATATGSATATVGYNLDTSILGLKNAASAGIKITLLPKTSLEKGAESGTYGWIKLEEFQVIIDDAAAWTITPADIYAKIVSGPFFVQIADEIQPSGSNATRKVSVGRFGLPNITDGNTLLTVQKLPAESPAGGYLYAGYSSDLFSLTVKVANTNDYCAAAQDAYWYIAPSASVTVAGATVKGGVIFSTIKGYDPGIGASVSYSMALTDTITLAPSAGFDYVLAEKDANKAMAIGAGVFAKWAGNDEYDAYMNLTQTAGCGNTYSTGADIKYQGGAGVAVQYYKPNATADGQINVIAQVNEQRGDTGLVPALGAAVGLYVSDVTNADKALKNPQMNFGAFANYAIGNITPYFRLNYAGENTSVVGTVETKVKASATVGAGVEVASILPNTKLTLDYNTWNALADKNNQGIFTAAVKIAF